MRPVLRKHCLPMNDHENNKNHFADSERIWVVCSGLDLVEALHQPIDLHQSIETHDNAAWYAEITEQARIKKINIRWQRADHIQLERQTVIVVGPQFFRFPNQQAAFQVGYLSVVTQKKRIRLISSSGSAVVARLVASKPDKNGAYLFSR